MQRKTVFSLKCPHCHKTTMSEAKRVNNKDVVICEKCGKQIPVKNTQIENIEE